MKCEKCGYESKDNKKKFGLALCEICYHFSPDEEKLFQQYVKEKIPGEILETFRRNYIPRKEKQKQGMIKKAVKGNLMSRAPFGYGIQDRKLVPSENYKEVEEIFEKFLNNNISLRQLAEEYNFSVNGLKKILKNFTYIGKIKFNNQVYPGNHQPIISATLFNKVQDKLEKLGIK